MSRLKRTTTEMAKEVEEVAKSNVPLLVDKPEPRWDTTISTGSTLLDLAISYDKVHGGGLPGGMIMEIFGPNGTGKTSLMAEIAGNAQRAGGEVKVRDPEARLSPQYCKQMGVYIDDNNYGQPDTVSEMFEELVGAVVGSGTKVRREEGWTPDPTHINIYGADSLAALTTNLEMKQGDKMGQRRAKEFSEGLRLATRHIHKYNILMICTNQVRDNLDTGGVSTPGGHGIPFYSSLRIRLTPGGKLESEKTIHGVTQKRAYGIEVNAFIFKSSLGKPYRVVPLYLLFEYGFDNLRGNLQWLKTNTKASTYKAVDKSFQSMNQAIAHIEENNLEKELAEEVIKLWEEIEQELLVTRKPKVRL